MNRIKRIEEKLLKNIWDNGGHWVELEMKNGDKIYIQRQNHESYQNLSKEKFKVSVNDTTVLSKVNLEEVANYINSNF